MPFHLLREEQGMSVGEPGTGNLIVEGDNLSALKALLPYYAGQVKCIYIDPPYNTGNENWVYNDNVNSSEIRRWLGKVVGGEAEDLSRHDKWLCMMYPRLCLLREMLREDGAIFLQLMTTRNTIYVLLWMRSSVAITLLPPLFGRKYFLPRIRQGTCPRATIIYCSMARMRISGDRISFHVWRLKHSDIRIPTMTLVARGHPAIVPPVIFMVQELIRLRALLVE